MKQRRSITIWRRASGRLERRRDGWPLPRNSMLAPRTHDQERVLAGQAPHHNIPTWTKGGCVSPAEQLDTRQRRQLTSSPSGSTASAAPSSLTAQPARGGSRIAIREHTRGRPALLTLLEAQIGSPSMFIHSVAPSARDLVDVVHSPALRTAAGSDFAHESAADNPL